jgi:hypothetical protein
MKTCLPFFHDYVEVGLKRMEDVTFGTPGIKYTDFYLRCTRCGKRRVKSVSGWWDE